MHNEAGCSLSAVSMHCMTHSSKHAQVVDCLTAHLLQQTSSSSSLALMRVENLDWKMLVATKSLQTIWMHVCKHNRTACMLHGILQAPERWLCISACFKSALVCSDKLIAMELFRTDTESQIANGHTI